MDVYKLKCIYEGNEDFVLTVADNTGQAKKNVVKYYSEQNKNKFVDIVAVISGFLNANRTDLYGLKNETVIWLLENVYHTIFESKVQSIFCNFNTSQQAQLKVCELNGNAIQFIENPSKDVIIASIDSNPESIVHLEEISNDILDTFIKSIQINIIKQSWRKFKYDKQIRLFDILRKCSNLYNDNEKVLISLIENCISADRGNYGFHVVEDIAKTPDISSEIQLYIYKEYPFLVGDMIEVNEKLQFKVIEEFPAYFKRIDNPSISAIEYAKYKCKQSLLDGTYFEKYSSKVETYPRIPEWKDLLGLDIIEKIDYSRFNYLKKLIKNSKRNKYNGWKYSEYTKSEDLCLTDQVYIEVYKYVYKSRDEDYYNIYHDVMLFKTSIRITTPDGINFSISCKSDIDDLDNQKYLYGLLELFELNY